MLFPRKFLAPLSFVSMTSTLLENIFINVEPFRATLLTMLQPFDIAKLLAAINCGLSKWEQKRHMDILDDIVEDSADIALMTKLGMTIRLFGSDLNLLKRRIRDPCGYLEEFRHDRSFHVFVVATSHVPHGQSPRLIQDFRPEQERNIAPEDMNMSDLHQNFDSHVTTGVAVISKWILCAPYLSGSLPSSLPGWIPVFNSRPGVNVRAFISSFSGRNSRILRMDRALISRVFGFRNKTDILSNLTHLKTPCITLHEEQRQSGELQGRLTLNYTRDVLLAQSGLRGKGKTKIVVVNSVHPLNSAITLSFAS